MAVVRVCYKSDGRFDEHYYLSQHLPLAVRIMKPFGLGEFDVMRLETHPDGSRPPYSVIFSGHFESMAKLQHAMVSPGMEEILADIPNYYDGSAPDVFIGELLAIPEFR